MVKRMFIVGAVMAVVASTAMATPYPTLSAMPTVGTATTSQANAVTADGAYVGGTSGAGALWQVGSSTAVVASGGSWGNLTAGNGIGYRMVGTEKQIVMHGLAGGWSASIITANAGATWSQGTRSANIGNAPSINFGNSLGSSGTDDSWYVGFMSNTGNSPTLYVEKNSGATPALVTRDTKGTTTKTQVHQMSYTGLLAGARKEDGTNYAAYKSQYDGDGGLTSSYFNALHGDHFGENWAVSGDGSKLFGMGAVLDGRTGQWPWVKAASAAATDPATELPSLPGVAGSVNNGIVYAASADGTLASGMSYQGGEHAVLWYLEGSTWKILDLSQYAADVGIDGAWQQSTLMNALRRAYSVGRNALGQPVVVGYGVNTAGLTTGFAITVPEPATLAFLALGGLAMLRRRR